MLNKILKYKTIWVRDVKSIKRDGMPKVLKMTDHLDKKRSAKLKETFCVISVRKVNKWPSFLVV
jgi:hypothetical protein